MRVKDKKEYAATILIGLYTIGLPLPAPKINDKEKVILKYREGGGGDYSKHMYTK